MINIIIPVYNNKHTLETTLYSLCAQSKQMFITTIVEDCGDETEDIDTIVNNFQNKLIIRYLKNEQNIGPGLSRQRGIDSDTMCDYVMFLDSDDILYPRAIEVLYKQAKLQDFDVLASNIQVQRQHSTGFVLKASDAVTWLHGKVYKKSFLTNNHIHFPNNKRLNEDSYFNLVAIHSTDKIGYIDEITYYWRDYQYSLTRCSSIDFNRKYNVDFLLGQIEAIQEIYRIKQTLDFSLSNTFVKLYEFYQKEKYEYNNDVTIINQELNKLFNLDYVIQFLRQEEIKQSIIDSIHIGYKTDEGIIQFYHNNFLEWVGYYNNDLYN